MQEQQLFEKLRDMIAEHLDIAKTDVTLESDLRHDLPIDSLALYELFMQIEEKFEIQIPDPDVDKFRRVRDVVAYLAERGVAAA